ncbi:hypothetical protein AB0J48_20595 [Nocardia salmonicida]|uniref:hypothetical protein n=1 Tax=Nocardia salmonicida TaxID=53431 RepID=UPI00341C589E
MFGTITELTTGIPDLASAVDEILAPLAEDIQLAQQMWSREHYAAPPVRFVLGVQE